MTLKDLKDLEKVIRICRRAGVDAMKIDGVEFHLGPEPKAPAASKAWLPVNTDPGAITADTKIPTDVLSEEDMLFYSVDAQNQ